MADEGETAARTSTTGIAGVYMHAADPLSKAPRQSLGVGAVVLPGFAGGTARRLLDAVAGIAAQAPFRHMTTRQGFRLSVAMTACGERGWVSDRRGYRYVARDPESDRPWPAFPAGWLTLAGEAARVAGFTGFVPDTCLINRYAPGARLGLHADSDEPDAGAPVVSVSLGLPAVFLWGGPTRASPTVAVPLRHGDVMVWGGPARRYYHGVRPLRAAAGHGAPGRSLELDLGLGLEEAAAAGASWPDVAGVTRHEGQPCRVNLTFRRTGLG